MKSRVTERKGEIFHPLIYTPVFLHLSPAVVAGATRPSRRQQWGELDRKWPTWDTGSRFCRQQLCYLAVLASAYFFERQNNIKRTERERFLLLATTVRSGGNQEPSAPFQLPHGPSGAHVLGPYSAFVDHILPSQAHQHESKIGYKIAKIQTGQSRMALKVTA